MNTYHFSPISIFLIVLSIFSINTSCEKDKDKPNGETPYKPTPYQLKVPQGFLNPFENPDNPLTVEGVALGRKLFYEKRLSGNNTMSCGSCHKQEFAFSDAPNALSVGIDGLPGVLNSMHLVNLAWLDRFFWDGRETSLEGQAFHPIVDPLELNTNWESVVAKLELDGEYPELFKKAFGNKEISMERITKAIAQFEKTLISGNSKFDQVMRGEATFTQIEQQGELLFNVLERGDCFHCHGSTVTGNLFGAFGNLIFTNNGLDTDANMRPGLMAVTGRPQDKGKFKIPSLRNVAVTFPYMHDGRFANLNEVIDFYDFGGHPSATIDPNMKAAGTEGRKWSQFERQSLIAFMQTLTDEEFLLNPEFSDPNEE